MCTFHDVNNIYWNISKTLHLVNVVIKNSLSTQFTVFCTWWNNICYLYYVAK